MEDIEKSNQAMNLVNKHYDQVVEEDLKRATLQSVSTNTRKKTPIQFANPEGIKAKLANLGGSFKSELSVENGHFVVKKNALSEALTSFTTIAVAAAIVASVVQTSHIVSNYLDTRQLSQTMIENLQAEIPSRLPESEPFRFVVYDQIADQYHLDLKDTKDQDFLFYLVRQGSPEEARDANFQQVLNDYGFYDTEDGKTATEKMLLNRGYYYVSDDGTVYNNAPDMKVYINYQESRMSNFLESSVKEEASQNARL